MTKTFNDSLCYMQIVILKEETKFILNIMVFCILISSLSPIYFRCQEIFEIIFNAKLKYFILCFRLLK